MEIIMKKIFLVLTLTLISSSAALFGMEMEQVNFAPQNEMVTIEIEQQQFKTQRKYAELSTTIKYLIEDYNTENKDFLKDDDSLFPLDRNSEQW